MPVQFWDIDSNKRTNTESGIFGFGEGPTYVDNKWDYVQFGNPNDASGERADPRLKTPGLATVKCMPQREIDKKKRHGSDGATLTIYGYLPGEVSVTVEIWTDEQWTKFQQLLRFLYNYPTKDPQGTQLGIDIHHPEVDLWKIKSVVFVSASSSSKGQAFGSKIWTLKFIENVPPPKKSATRTIKGSSSGAPHVSSTVSGLAAKNDIGDKPSKASTGPNGKSNHEGG